MDRILESIVERLGDLEQAWLVDDYAEGKDTGLVDRVLVGDVDQANLADLVAKTERYVGRKIRTVVLPADEKQKFDETLSARPQLLLWRKEDLTAAD